MCITGCHVPDLLFRVASADASSTSAACVTAKGMTSSSLSLRVVLARTGHFFRCKIL